VDKISALGPRVIALDVVFDTPGWDAGGDDALARSLANAGNVILASHLEDQSGAAYQNITYSPPIEKLSSAAILAAPANFPGDADGAIRHANLAWAWNDQSLVSFPYAIASVFNGTPIKINVNDVGLDLRFPMRFRGPEKTFTTISMIDVWNGDAPPEVFRDAIVLVGYTTQLEQDRFVTPFTGSSKMAGVEIQATAVDNLLAGDWMRELPEWAVILLVALGGLLAVVLLNLPRSGWGLAGLLILLISFVLLAQAVSSNSNLILPIAAPVLATLVTGGASLGERLIFAEREKRLLRQRFSGMMSAERLHTVMNSWDDLCRADRPPKPAAVMFADVRGFTHATETLMRQNRHQEMVSFLSGVIYRMLGDGLLVMFGMPEVLPDHSLSAVRAAVRMAQAAQELQSIWPLRDEAPLGMGMGIHCGEMVDAIVGRGRRVDYAIIGDPANTAARIESHCKVAVQMPRPPGGDVPESTTILISRTLFENVKDHVLVDESIPPFEARGKSEAVQVVRLLGLQKGDL
jgi:adenylate cyclase